MDIETFVAALDGGRRLTPTQFVKSFIAKQKSKGYSRSNIVKPFDPKKVKNQSEFLQRKYGDPSKPVKPFDYCKAQQRKKEAEDDEAYSVARLMVTQNISAEEAIRQWERRGEVMRPEYWGLTWNDLTPVGNWYVTKDGLRFPPVPWFNPKDGKTYWGLACCGGKPEAGKKKQRYKMLYFKEGEVPTFETNTFGDTAAKIKTKADPKLAADVDTYAATIATRVSGNDYTTEAVDRRTRRGIVTDEKTIKGVKLKGTNQTLAKSDVADSKYARSDKVTPTFTKPKPKKPTAAEVDRVRRAMGKTARPEPSAPPAPTERTTNIPKEDDGSTRSNAAPARSSKPTREDLRLAYNKAQGPLGTADVTDLVRIAVAIGVPNDSDLKYLTRAGIMKRIMKHAPTYDINTGSKKAPNGDILVAGPKC